MATKTEELDLDELMRSKREALTARRGELQTALNDVDEQLRRIEGYLNPAPVQAVQTVQPTKAVQPSQPRAPRKPREGGGSKQHILDLLQKHPDGLLSAQIAEQLPDIKSLPNLLSGMAKDNVIHQTAKRQPYKLGPKPSSLDAVIDDVPSADERP